MKEDEKKSMPDPSEGWETEECDVLSEAFGDSYLAIRNLAEAKSYEDGVLVLEGEYGGVIYLVCPVSRVRCDEVALRGLLEEIDSRCVNDLAGARVVYRRLSRGSIVAGGRGGGQVLDGLWLNADVRKLGLEPTIRQILLRGESD